MESWVEEDFVDPPSLVLQEEDPWSDTTGDHKLVEANLQHQSTWNSESRGSGSEQSADQSEDTSGNGASLFVAGKGYGYYHSRLGEEQFDIGSEIPANEDPGLLVSESWLVEEVFDRDEPDPSVEFDPDLKEVLYPKEGLTGLFQKLKIDEFISGVDQINEIQFEEISVLLADFGAARLRRWMPWLRTKAWSGHSLLLFLEFRNLWDSNPVWWEYWYRGVNSNRNSLSLDATYALVQQRLDCKFSEVIDEAWFRDWENLELWKRGFPSFASFVLFRAALGADEDWRSCIGQCVDFQSIKDDELGLRMTSRELLNLVDPHGSLRRFSEQDWYDSAEWHDNLGWQ